MIDSCIKIILQLSNAIFFLSYFFFFFFFFCKLEIWKETFKKCTVWSRNRYTTAVCIFEILLWSFYLSRVNELIYLSIKKRSMYVLDIFHVYIRRYSRNFDPDYYFYLKLISP